MTMTTNAGGIINAGGFAHAHYPVTDFDDAYDNRGHIKGADDYIANWHEQAAGFRKTARQAEFDVPYGADPRQCYDVFMPEAPVKGTCVFVHGGYWMRFDKSCWSHLSAGALAHGWRVVMPSYRLAPNVSVAMITRDITEAVNQACADGTHPVVLAGHSAGGHLVSRLVCADTQLKDSLLGRISHILSISGVHDLRPLLQLKMNDVLQLDRAMAEQESPALCQPVSGIRLSCVAGARERPEFIRQNALLANIWAGLGAHTGAWVAPDCHHFDIIDSLQKADSALTLHMLGIDYLN